MNIFSFSHDLHIFGLIWNMEVSVKTMLGILLPNIFPEQYKDHLKEWYYYTLAKRNMTATSEQPQVNKP
jgi:hypothetical protein